MSAAIVLALLTIAAIAEGDPTKAHTRARLKLRAGRDVTVLVMGGSISPFADAADDDNKAPYAWFVWYLRHAFPEANVATVRSVWNDATAEQLKSRAEPVLRAVKPDITILCLGSADYSASTPPDAYALACAELISTVAPRGGFVIVAGAVLPQVVAAGPLRIHTKRSAFDAGCVYVDFDAMLRQSGIPIGALLRSGRHLTAKGAVLLADGLIAAWCRPVADTHGQLPDIEMKIYGGETSLGGYLRADTTLVPRGGDAFVGDVTMFFGEVAESRHLTALPGQPLITPWILRMPVSLAGRRSAVTPLTMQINSVMQQLRCRMRYVVIAPAVFVDTRSPPTVPHGPERFRLGPANLIFGKYGGPADIDAEVEIKGDARAFQITIAVDDQSVVREPPDSPRAGDRIEILLDLRPQRQVLIDHARIDEQARPPREYGDWQGDPLSTAEVWRIVVTPPTVDGSPPFHVGALTRPEDGKATSTRQQTDPEAHHDDATPDIPDESPDETHEGPNAAGLEALQTADVQSAITPTGYRIEVSIPWASLDTAAGRAIESFGFDLILQDADGPMLPCSRLVLFGTDPPDPSLFGLITHNSRYRKGLVRVIAP